jgi:pimeloyl-ACP methyl ester carboxylesterase
MRKGYWLLWMCIAWCSVALAQQTKDISGKWYGVTRSYYGDKQRLTVVLEKAGEGYTGELQNPDHEDAAISLDHVIYRGDTLLLRIDTIRFAYTGVWNAAEKQFEGIFSWGGLKGTFNISRKEIKKSDVYKRPQEPKPPYPYYTDEVKFENAHNHLSLAGTFTRPAEWGRYPVVILLSGSGPQDRNDEMAGHKTFLVLADFLARNGIASLRFDDRGTGGSGGVYGQSSIYDFANDAKAALEYLKTRKDVDPYAIGLLGHSEGAAVAQIAAANNKSVAFVVSLAGPGVTGRELVDQKIVLDGRMSGASDGEIMERLQRLKPYWDALASDTNYAVAAARAKAALRDIYRHSPEDVKKQVSEEEFTSDLQFDRELSSILLYKPLDYLKQIKCPFMAINGTRDLQVDATTNLNAIERALRENGNMLVTIRKFDGLNHLFQRCKTCTVAEYGDLEQTIDPLVPEFIAHWILQLPPRPR